MKPILFNTDMVCAILANRKTVTRRVVKPQPEGRLVPAPSECCWPGYFAYVGSPCVVRPPCRPGDILYVREAFQQNYDWSYSYRAGHKFESAGGWRPSIHMPREAARIFLRVTDVRVERLQDIDERGPLSAASEGFTNDIDLYSGTGKSATKYFAECWDSTIKPKDRTLYSWASNPWVWVIKFEKISKEEAIKYDETQRP